MKDNSQIISTNLSRVNLANVMMSGLQDSDDRNQSFGSSNIRFQDI